MARNSSKNKNKQLKTDLNNAVPENNPGTVTPVAKDPNFEQAIQESKAAIQAEGLKDVKKRVGRPRKEVPPTPQNNTLHAAQPGIQSTPDTSKYLAGPLMALSKIPAHNKGIPELALTEDEAMLCAKSIDDLIKAFVPDLNNMSPKTAAIMGCCLTFGSIGFNKYAIYAAELKKREPKPETPLEMPVDKPVQNVDKPELKEPNVGAGEYFRNMSV